MPYLGLPTTSGPRIRIKITGLRNLELFNLTLRKINQELTNEILNAVGSRGAAELKNIIKGKVKGWSSGKLRDSVTYSTEGDVVKIWPDIDYAGWVDFGFGASPGRYVPWIGYKHKKYTFRSRLGPDQRTRVVKRYSQDPVRIREKPAPTGGRKPAFKEAPFKFFYFRKYKRETMPAKGFWKKRKHRGKRLVTMPRARPRMPGLPTGEPDIGRHPGFKGHQFTREFQGWLEANIEDFVIGQFFDALVQSLDERTTGPWERIKAKFKKLISRVKRRIGR